MATVSVGVQEFQDHFDDYIDAAAPVAVTRDGRRVGLFIPSPRKPSAEDRAALREASERVQQTMTAVGITEEELVKDFEDMRRLEREARNGRQ